MKPLDYSQGIFVMLKYMKHKQDETLGDEINYKRQDIRDWMNVKSSKCLDAYKV